MMRVCTFSSLAAFAIITASAQSPMAWIKPVFKDSTLAGRWGVSGGMGVSYINAQDVVDLVSSRANQRMPAFKAAVEFFGNLVVPVSEEWSIKCEYAYILGSYNFNSSFGSAEASFNAHMPSVIAQYSLVDEGVYNVKIGLGGGYHFGSYSETIFGSENTYKGKGIGTTADLEANTAFSENLYAYLGADLRWEFIGDLTDSAGKSPIVSNLPITLHFFGLGARLGFSYYF